LVGHPVKAATMITGTAPRPLLTATSRCQLAAGKAEEERNSSAIADDDNAASGQLALDNAALEATAFAFG
jgi:hypothetical protein